MLAPYKEVDVVNSNEGIQTPKTEESYTETDAHTDSTNEDEDITGSIEKIDKLEFTVAPAKRTKKIAEENGEKNDELELTETPSHERKEIGRDTNSDEIKVGISSTNKALSQELYEDDEREEKII